MQNEFTPDPVFDFALCFAMLIVLKAAASLLNLSAAF